MLCAFCQISSFSHPPPFCFLKNFFKAVFGFCFLCVLSSQFILYIILYSIYYLISTPFYFLGTWGAKNAPRTDVRFTPTSRTNVSNTRTRDRTDDIKSGQILITVLTIRKIALSRIVVKPQKPRFYGFFAYFAPFSFSFFAFWFT